MPLPRRRLSPSESDAPPRAGRRLLLQALTAGWLGALARGLPAAAAATPGSPEWPDTAARWLGLSERELQAALPDLQRLRRAQSGPRGLRAWWMRPGTPGDGGDTFFFLREQTVVHIEQRWRSDAPRCPVSTGYQSLRERLSQRLGPPSASAGDAGSDQASSAWAAGPYDVRLHLEQGGGRCQLLLVHELHAARDASEL